MRIAIFCGSSMGIDPCYAEAARLVGRALAEAGHGVVYGGGKVGLMGTVADAALAAGGEVIGVIPRHLQARELAHTGLSRLLVVDSMHERKAQMAALADAFIALPGGAGTLEEIFEVWTWAQLGLHRKPCAFFDVAGYYEGIGAFVDHAVTQGFLHAEYRDMLFFGRDIDRLLDTLARYQAPPPKWHERATEGPAALDVLGWVCLTDRRVLMARSQGKELFFIPGGKREAGESDWQALSREIREELAVELVEETAVQICTVEDQAWGVEPPRRVRMSCYMAAHAGRMAAAGEIAEIVWLQAADAPRCAPAARQVLAWLHARSLID
ncbi:MAG: TIGR00730 family Rossman fold protein [Rhodocyclaceae bacterium]